MAFEYQAITAGAASFISSTSARVAVIAAMRRSAAARASASEAAPADGDASRRPVSPFAPEAMADNFPRFAGPRPSPPPSAQAPSAKTDRSFIDTMPIPDVVIRPSVKGAGLPALIEPKTSRRMSIVLATSLQLVVAAAAAVYVFRAEILAALPAEWRTMLRLSP